MSAGITIKVERELDAEFIGNVLVTAFDGQYGGCNYWATRPSNSALGDDAVIDVDEADNWTVVRRRLIESTGIAPIDLVSMRRFSVDKEVIKTGIQIILDGDIDVSDSIKEYITRGVLEAEAGEIDSIAADCIVQAGWFGKVIYA